MLRIDCLGSDHDGSHYFALPEAVESDGDSDDDADDDDDAPAAPEQKKAERVRLIVESRDGSVGELSSATELKKALRTSKDERDRRLLHALSKHEALKRMGERDAGPATTKITKTTHGDYDTDGHAWIGRRVRFVDEDEGGDPVDGTVISWRPAQTAAAAAAAAAAEEEEEASSQSGEAPSPTEPVAKPATFRVEYDDGEVESYDEDALVEPLAEAEDAAVRELRREMHYAVQEVHELRGAALPPPPADVGGDADEWWVGAAKEARTPPAVRRVLAAIEEAGVAARARAGEIDDGAARAKRLAALAKWSREWRSRLAESATTSQLALRLVEVEFATFERNEGSHRMGAGDAIEMNFDDEWKRGTVLGVFRDGAFRASAKMSDKTGDFDQYEDFLPPKSRDGKKEVGKEWRWPPKERAARGGAAKGRGARKGGGEAIGRGSKRDAATKAQGTWRAVAAAEAEAVDDSQSSDDDGDDDASAGSGGASDDDDDSGDGGGGGAAERSREPQLDDEVEVADAPPGGKRKQKRDVKWQKVVVTRVFRGGAFEVMVPEAKEEGADDEGDGEEEEEEEAPRVKRKLSADSRGSEWRWPKAAKK